MMIVKTIVTGFNADDLFNSWDSDDVARYDERASAERYQELCAEALHEVHPNAEVTIIVNHDSSGALPRGLRTQVNGIDASEANNDEIFDVEYVDEVCSQVYFGYEWLVARPFISAATAQRQFDVPRATITWACRTGRIADAIKNGNRWEFPLDSFLAWNNSRGGTVIYADDVEDDTRTRVRILKAIRRKHELMTIAELENHPAQWIWLKLRDEFDYEIATRVCPNSQPDNPLELTPD